jgi:general secretion pathway protein G
MKSNSREAFTMLELVFVVAVKGILAAVAIPKFAVNRDDAVIAKAKSTVAAIRSSIATERQKSILRGVFDPITSLSSATGYGVAMFDGINGDSSNPVLEYPLMSCADANAHECWYTADNITYSFKMPVSGSADFNLTSSRFVCNSSPESENCKLLTR